MILIFQVLTEQALLAASIRSRMSSNNKRPLPPRACAAAGQSSISQYFCFHLMLFSLGGLMAFYASLFAQKSVAVSQILVTDGDFTNEVCLCARLHFLLIIVIRRLVRTCVR